MKPVMRRLIVLCVVCACALSPLAAQSEDDPVLYALGAVGVSNLYFSYSFLGSVADGIATGTYDQETAAEMVDDSISLNTSSRDVLKALLDSWALADTDRAVLERMIDAHSALVRQGWGLLAYIEDPTDVEDYRDYRELAWGLISELFGR